MAGCLVSGKVALWGVACRAPYGSAAPSDASATAGVCTWSQRTSRPGRAVEADRQLVRLSGHCQVGAAGLGLIAEQADFSLPRASPLRRKRSSRTGRRPRYRGSSTAVDSWARVGGDCFAPSESVRPQKHRRPYREPRRQERGAVLGRFTCSAERCGRAEPRGSSPGRRRTSTATTSPGRSRRAAGGCCAGWRSCWRGRKERPRR